MWCIEKDMNSKEKTQREECMMDWDWLVMPALWVLGVLYLVVSCGGGSVLHKGGCTAFLMQETAWAKTWEWMHVFEGLWEGWFKGIKNAGSTRMTSLILWHSVKESFITPQGSGVLGGWGRGGEWAGMGWVRLRLPLTLPYVHSKTVAYLFYLLGLRVKNFLPLKNCSSF